MAHVRITGSTEECLLPLAPTTLVGRHESCTWVLDAPQIPTFWVELRWTEAGWTWRELGGDARGPRRPVRGRASGWWLLDAGQRINGRGIVLELLDDRAPQRFTVDLASGEVLLGQDLLALVAEDGAQPTPADWERREEAEPLRDGATFTIGGRAFRFHDAAPVPATAQRRIDLAQASVQLELSRGDGGPLLQLWDGPVELSLQGAYLWALVPYIEARLADLPREGWLGLDEAHSRWQELCPHSSSEPERVGQDRSRICRALHARGVANPHALFARRRFGKRWGVRLLLEPRQVELNL